MTPLQTIREAVVKAIPEILELKFGCVVKSTNGHELPPIEAPIVMEADGGRYVVSDKNFGVVGNYAPKDLIVLGRPIQLADVLRTLFSKEYIWSTSYLKGGEMMVFTMEAPPKVEKWDLSKPLDSQSPETLDFLSKILQQ